MKKSKKPIIGGILLGVGVLGFMGIATTENKAALIAVCIGFIIAGAILLYLGIKANKRIASTPAAESDKTPAPVASVPSPAPAPASVKANGKILDEWDCSVWGTTYTNDNGTNRQSIITKLKVGADLLFKPAPTEEYPDTIGVFTKKGEQIGFIGYKDLNKMRGLYADKKASVTVKNIEKSERGLGVTMHIVIYK